jgi:hypothetical protein
VIARKVNRLSRERLVTEVDASAAALELDLICEEDFVQRRPAR